VIHLDVRADIREAERFYSNLRKNAVKKAAARAINDTLTTLRNEGTKMIKRDHPALKSGEIKRRMNRKLAHMYNLRGSVGTEGFPLSALLFRPQGGRGARKRVPPVSLHIGKNRFVVDYHGRKAFRVKAFGNEVFVRRFGKGRRLMTWRGPSMPGVFRAKGNEMLALARARWQKTFASRMQYEIALAKRV
jgi:hypothetical protein